MADETQGSQDTVEKIAPSKMQKWWKANRGWVLVLISECFGACMAATARMLEDNERGNAMHPQQIIFVRMGLTFLLSSIYMWLTSVPHFPLGAKGIRALLVLRGATGFFGLAVFYWALQYLPLAETTVITFLTPMMVPLACALLFNEALSKKVVAAGIVSFTGVIIISKPPFLFPTHEDTPSSNAAMRTFAVVMLLLSSMTATASYTLIRAIGYRAHALISVNYYAFMSTLGAGLYLLFAPGVGFRLPADARQWALLSVIGLSGFFLQFLLTAGLQYDKSAIATSMMYSQVLFALLFDKVIWGNVPDTASICGGLLVLVSTVYVAFQGSSSSSDGKREAQADEEEPLLRKHDGKGTMVHVREEQDGNAEAGANLVDE